MESKELNEFIEINERIFIISNLKQASKSETINIHKI